MNGVKSKINLILSHTFSLTSVFISHFLNAYLTLPIDWSTSMGDIKQLTYDGYLHIINMQFSGMVYSNIKSFFNLGSGSNQDNRLFRLLSTDQWDIDFTAGC